MTNSQKSVRYHHLDALRAFLMMFGIPIHTASLGNNLVFDQLTYLSSLVRMEAFFTISGFLCALVLSRYGSSPTIRKRIQSIGVPLVAGLIILNPITNYLVYNYHNNPISLLDFFSGNNVSENSKGTVVWHLHLWFLFPLLIYGIFTPAIYKIISNIQKRNYLSAGSQLDFLIICVVVASCCLAARIVFFLSFQAIIPENPFNFIIRETMYNFSFYSLGILLFINSNLYKAFHKPHYFYLVLSISFAVVYELYTNQQDSNTSKVFGFFVYAFLAVILTNLLLVVTFKIFNQDNKIIRFFSNASYSVYIFHYITIYLLAYILSPLISNSYVFFTMIALLTLILTCALHKILISKSTILQLIFNGKAHRNT